jgi:hypothetical protein
MIAIASCTQQADYKQTLLYKSLAKLERLNNLVLLDKVYFFTQNKLGLSQAYNQFIKDNPNCDIIIFIHDDVWIDDAGFLAKLEEAHKTYDIVGIAGGLNPIIKAPALWHIMCGGFGSPNLRGFAGHYISPNDPRMMVTNFGPTPDRVVIIDGVLMSVNIKKAKSVGWKFNENYMYHHYDMSSCIDANRLKLKVGVTPILLYHMSPGLMNIDEPTFVKSQTQFLQEYSTH